MVVIIGGTAGSPGRNNALSGTNLEDIIFGDPHTAGAQELDPNIPEIGGTLNVGSGGNDRLNGLGSFDQLIGDAYVMEGTGQGGNDRLDGGAGFDQLYGDAIYMRGHSRGGNDVLIGAAGDDNALNGDAAEMQDYAKGGNDALYGGPGSDALVGDAIGSMSDNARGSNDKLCGAGGNDSLFGESYRGDEGCRQMWGRLSEWRHGRRYSRW